MRLSRRQIEALGDAHGEEVRARMVRDFQARGLEAEQDPATRSVLIRDKAGGEARISPTKRGVEIVGGEGSRRAFSFGQGGQLDAFEVGGSRFVLDHDKSGGLTAIRGPQGPLYKLEHGPLGKLTTIEDPAGARTTYEYDERANLIGFRDRNRSKTELLRDETGRLVGYVDPRGSETRFEYGERDVPETIALPNGDRWSFRFDDEGLLQSMLVNGFEHAAYEIDPDSGDVQIRYPDGTESRFKTDGDRVVEAANEHSTVLFVYDDQGRLLEEETSEGKVLYERDAVGAIIAVVAPDGARVGFDRDKENRVKTVVDWSGGRHRIEYDARGAISRLLAANGAETAFTSTDAGLPASMAVNAPGEPGGPTLIRSWSYSKSNKVTAEAAEFGRRKFQYDPEGRLTKVESSQPELQESWRVDPCGNKAFLGDVPCRYGRMNEIVSHGDQPFAYDALGNMTAGSCARGDTLFTYNRRNQLIVVDTPETTTRYGYDAIGRRIWKEHGRAITRYVWAGSTLLREITTAPDTSTRTDYLFLAGTPTPIAMRIDGRIHAIHAGRRMEPLCVTDDQGHVVWRARYDAFGLAHVLVAKIEQPLRLAGQMFDRETGLHYNLARYYNPLLGVFLSLDPVLGGGGSLNLYNYCDGDPLNAVDPTGEFIFCAILVGAAIGAVIAAGIETYSQYKKDGEITDGMAVAKAALIGGVVGAIGGAVGALVEGAVLVGATGLGALAAVGAISGGASSAVEYCAETALKGNEFDGWEMTKSVAIGTGLGLVTGPIGGLVARRLKKLNAIKTSNMVPEHGEAFSQVAKARDEVIMVRPVNPHATPHIKAGAATKGMPIKGKSADWGPHKGLIPRDQKYSKIGNPDGPIDDAAIAKYNKLNEKTIEKGDATTAWVDGPDGNKIEVLADPTTGKPITADYDLMAVGSKSGPGQVGEFDPKLGKISTNEKQTMTDLNDAVAETGYAGGNVVHHGPANRFEPKLDPKADFPVTAFTPDGRVHTIKDAGELDGFMKAQNGNGYKLEAREGWGLDSSIPKAK